LGAVVTQGYEHSFTQKTSGVTDGQGIARVGIHEGLAGAVVRFGSDTAVITDWADTLRGASPTRDASRTYVYTDRPIYRPSHTVHIRGIDRIGFDGKYEVWHTEKVPLKIFDSEGTQMYETSLEQNLYGTFSTKFDLPSDAPLGTYRIEAFGQSFYFDVEEYVPAAFKLEATTNKEEYINGDTFKVDVQADYYFGVPLDEGTVSYAVTAQDYYFDRYTDEYFNFGGDWYYCYSCGYGDNFLFRGETTIDENGRATIERSFNFDDYFDDVDDEGSKLVTVSVTAKDVNGRSVSLQKSFIVHKGEFYLGLKTDEYFTSVNSPNTLRVKTVDTEGKPLSVSNIEKVLYKVEWETFKRQEVDGGFYYRSEKKLTEVQREKIKTNDRGDWSGSLSLSSEGQYEVHVIGSDDSGNKLKTVTNVYIYGSESVTVPPNNNYELDLEVENTNVSVTVSKSEGAHLCRARDDIRLLDCRHRGRTLCAQVPYKESVRTKCLRISASSLT
jgi:alpha-2-macroglobulin